MKCLNDVEIQLVADNEAPAGLAEHVASCERCASGWPRAVKKCTASPR